MKVAQKARKSWRGGKGKVEEEEEKKKENKKKEETRERKKKKDGDEERRGDVCRSVPQKGEVKVPLLSKTATKTPPPLAH